MKKGAEIIVAAITLTEIYSLAETGGSSAEERKCGGREKIGGEEIWRGLGAGLRQAEVKSEVKCVGNRVGSMRGKVRWWKVKTFGEQKADLPDLICGSGSMGDEKAMVDQKGQATSIGQQGGQG